MAVQGMHSRVRELIPENFKYFIALILFFVFGNACNNSIPGKVHYTKSEDTFPKKSFLW